MNTHLYISYENQDVFFKEIDKKLGVGCKDCLVQSWFNNQLNDAAGTIETGVENSFR